MKNIKITFSILAIALTFVLSGCAKDSETTPDAGTREAFLGKWSVSETWTKLSYEVTISADPSSSNGVFISNFANTGTSSVPASAAVNGSTILLDTPQVIGDDITITGSGNLSGTKIVWSYSLDNGASLINAIATYTRQ
ncbi:MAG: hypothetical protein NTW16_17465 [Bacteroidetes bacterium]|nr:hypothetical protein [Bacteroidota bacterium]